jgi:predicted nucleic acid-binding protein
MPAPASRTAPALPPKVLGFRAALDSTAKVDESAGTITGIAVVTGNRQPLGWPMWADERSLDTFVAAFGALGRAKSYITHDGAPWADRQGREVGLFAGYRKDGAVFRADFSALAAFRKHELPAFDKLFELAKEAPATFGVSPVFSYSLAWVRQNGEEIPTEVATYRWDEAADDYLPVFDPTAPADARNPLPSVRAIEAFSVDFVDRPATNPGLFSAHGAPGQVDAPGKGVSPATPSSSAMSLHKQLFAKFRSNPAQFARATELHETDEKLTLDAIVATVEREGTTAEIATLRADLGKRDGELATLRESVKSKDGEIATLRADIVKRDETIASFRKPGAGGAEHVPTGGAGAGGEGGATTDPIAKLRAEINAITGTDEASAKRRGELTAKLRELKNKK